MILSNFYSEGVDHITSEVNLTWLMINVSYALID